MTVLEKFYDYAISQGIDKNAIYEEKGEGFVVNVIKLSKI